MTAIQNRRAMLVLIALSGLIISICLGLRQSLGLFMRPMTLELGISAATFGFSIALQNIVWGLSQPFVGAAADRYGPRPVLVATALVYAAGLLLMVFSNASREAQPDRRPGRRGRVARHAGAGAARPVAHQRLRLEGGDGRVRGDRGVDGGALASHPRATHCRWIFA